MGLCNIVVFEKFARAYKHLIALQLMLLSVLLTHQKFVNHLSEVSDSIYKPFSCSPNNTPLTDRKCGLLLL